MCGNSATPGTEPSPAQSAADASAGSGGPVGPSPDAFRRNMRQPMPLGRKVRLVVRNSALKVVTLKSCCGHPGEPGC
jgi:hypothetical protein